MACGATTSTSGQPTTAPTRCSTPRRATPRPSAIQLCSADYKIARVHQEKDQIVTAFGAFRPELSLQRQSRISNWVESVYGDVFTRPAHHVLGFDVAASGQGDLASIYVDQKEGDLLTLRGLFTCRTDDWDFLKTVLWVFLRKTPSVSGAGDETGMGRQICWETAAQFPGQFLPVNFRSKKHDMGFVLMNQLATAQKRFPEKERDIGADYFALRKTFAGGGWKFSEGKNAYNEHSHCDIAWSGALASEAGRAVTAPAFLPQATGHTGSRVAAARERSVTA